MLTPRRLATLATTSVLVCALQVSAALPSGAQRAVEAAPAVRVLVSCYANPELTKITNKKGSAITINKVGSIYKPYSNEPFTVSRKLGAGKSITFQTGNKAKGSNKLTGRYIYNNDVGDDEGARVKTSVGTFVDKCG